MHQLTFMAMGRVRIRRFGPDYSSDLGPTGLSTCIVSKCDTSSLIVHCSFVKPIKSIKRLHLFLLVIHTYTIPNTMMNTRHCTKTTLLVVLLLVQLSMVCFAMDPRPFAFGPNGHKWKNKLVKQKKFKYTGDDDTKGTLAMMNCSEYCDSGKKAIPDYYLVGNVIAQSNTVYKCQCFDTRNKMTKLKSCGTNGKKCGGGDVKEYGVNGAYQTFFCQASTEFPCSKTT